MNKQEVKERLMADARVKGICGHGYEKMRMSDIDGLVDYYLEVPDWGMERDFPSLRFLKDHFSQMEDRGVYVCRTFHGELLNDLQTYVFHHCKGTIKVGLNVGNKIIPMLYLANGCKMRIVGVGESYNKFKTKPSVVPLYIFGNNDVSARDNRHVVFRQFKKDLV